MGVRLILKDGCLTALLSGEIDHHVARELREEIDGTAMRTRPSVLKLDFSGVQFMDSSGIGVLAGRYRKISCFGGKVYVIHADERIRKILQMSGLTDLVEIMDMAGIMLRDVSFVDFRLPCNEDLINGGSLVLDGVDYLYYDLDSSKDKLHNFIYQDILPGQSSAGQAQGE